MSLPNSQITQWSSPMVLWPQVSVHNYIIGVLSRSALGPEVSDSWGNVSICGDPLGWWQPVMFPCPLIEVIWTTTRLPNDMSLIDR